MTDDMRKIVEGGYDEGDYESFFRKSHSLNRRERRFFKQLIEKIPKKSAILDLGSGTGIPYDKYLVKRGFDVTGIDLSSKHIAMAKKNVPGAKYIQADFSRFDFGLNVFDAVISFYAVFHIPREEHANLFTKIHSALKEKGILLVTMGTEDLELCVAEFIGSRMAWSSYSIPTNKRIIENAGFTLVHVEEQHEDPQEHHLWILAQKT
ncbi:MAG: class I SAM-dependent methyltransferase [Candidatus Hodarchaeota archaeon]